jgi:hypothetical protein
MCRDTSVGPRISNCCFSAVKVRSDQPIGVAEQRNGFAVQPIAVDVQRIAFVERIFEIKQPALPCKKAARVGGL